MFKIHSICFWFSIFPPLLFLRKVECIETKYILWFQRWRRKRKLAGGKREKTPALIPIRWIWIAKRSRRKSQFSSWSALVPRSPSWLHAPLNPPSFCREKYEAEKAHSYLSLFKSHWFVCFFILPFKLRWIVFFAEGNIYCEKLHFHQTLLW